MDVTPLIPSGRQIIESYGDGRFRVAGAVFEGSILVFPSATTPWPITTMAELNLASLSRIAASGQAGEVDLLLLGCGARLQQVPRDLRAGLRADGVVIEPMDTGAAARTYNVLMAEGRRVAAALIAV